MPYTPSLPTWVALNNMNQSSDTGITDVNTGQPIAAGGLNIGAYFDCTEQEANTASYATNGICHSGRYRYVRVDSGATAANVKTGTIGYIRAGSFVQTAVITNAGTGATIGTYSIAATVGSGGGAGAVLQVVVGSAGTITSVSVLNGGSGYSSVPSFSLTVTGTTGGTVAAQLNSSPNQVTSYDVAVAANAALAGVGRVRPVIFLNAATPGNCTFVQELGVATVLGAASFTGSAATAAVIEPTTGGLANVPTSTTAITTSTIGQSLDLPVVSNLFKILLEAPVVQD